MFSLFCFVFVVGIGFAGTDSETDGFSGNVKKLFEDLTEYTANVNIAKNKMDEFKDETWDRKYAIAIINLYTQPGQFYFILNSEMKNGYPANTDIWRRGGDLINRAVDILAPQVFPQVYRGCQVFDYLPIQGQSYNFGHIIKASQLKEAAIGFVKCANDFLFQIDKPHGVSVGKYSYNSTLEEVIIKSTHNFFVYDGPYRDGEYDLYFLREQASESVNDGNKNDAKGTTYGSSSLKTFSILLLFFMSNI